MLKNKLVLFLTILLSIVLVNLNAIAFHESPFGHTEHLMIDKEEGVKRKELQSLYCTQSVKKHKEPISIKSDSEEKNPDESDAPKESETSKENQTEVYKEMWVINHYHVGHRDFTGSLNLEILKDMDLFDSEDGTQNTDEKDDQDQDLEEDLHPEDLIQDFTDRVLIVDDLGDMRKMMSTALKSSNFQTISAKNGKDAFEKANVSDKIDIVIGPAVVEMERLLQNGEG